MTRRHILFATIVTVLVVGLVPLSVLAEPPAQGTNLLRNPGFEGITCAANSPEGWCNDNWTRDCHDGSVHDNIFTPQGWVSWWRKGGDYGQPEIKTIPRVAPFIGPPARIHSGNYAAMYFNFFRNQDGGFYQVVTGLPAGATVQFSAYAHGFSCDNDDSHALTCGDPYNQSFQVGIEPNGLADPFSPSVVWSPDQWSPDEYRLIGPVTAQVGPSGNVVVFLRSKSKWPVKHLDAYWDDASLVIVSQGTPPTNTPAPSTPPPTPTSGPSPTPRPPATPRPDGAVVHVVQSGDTLSGIALQYGTTVEAIKQLNAGSIGDNNLIVVGQELVVSMPAQTATPTPLPEPPTATPTPPTESAQPSATPGAQPGGEGGASICVLAYHDRNGDTFYNADSEELLPNAEIVLANTSGVLDRYVTDGVSEPHCFSGLAEGAYRVMQTAPAGYQPSGPAEWPAALGGTTKLDLQFGNVRSEATVAPASGSGPGGGAGGVRSTSMVTLFQTVAKVAGILVLVLAVGVAVLFVATRRRA
jgi:LysM repeat protein